MLDPAYMREYLTVFLLRDADYVLFVVEYYRARTRSALVKRHNEFFHFISSTLLLMYCGRPTDIGPSLAKEADVCNFAKKIRRGLCFYGIYYITNRFDFQSLARPGESFIAPGQKFKKFPLQRVSPHHEILNGSRLVYNHYADTLSGRQAERKG